MSRWSETPPGGDGWRLRPYREGDERWIVRQFERIFSRQMSPERWRWKLKTLPSPVENVWLGVDEGDRPIFQYAAVPRRLRSPAGVVDALVLVDLWTAPEYQRRGIFTASARWVHDYWRRGGVAGVLSPFNAREEPHYRHFGWRHLFPLRWQIRPLRPEAILARRLGIAGLARRRWLGRAWNRLWDRAPASLPGVEIREVDGADPAALERAGGGAGYALEHDDAWVRWRYLDCPHHRYTVLSARREGHSAGHLAYRIEATGGRRFAFVSELVTGDRRVEGALIDAAVARALERGAVAVATLATPGTGLYRAWRRRGFLFSWGRFCVHWLPLAGGLSADRLKDPKAWEMSGGDYDVI